MCPSFNFIKAKFETGSQIEYEGLGNSREGVLYIKKGDEIFKPNEKFIIDSNNPEIEIYFSEKVTSLKDMFNGAIDWNMKDIVSIDFSNFNTSFLTDMNSLFNGCSSLKTIYFSNFDTSLVTDMSNLFSMCRVLESIDLSSFNTEAVTNMNSMFFQCEKLKTIDIINFKTSNVTNMGAMFQECKALLSAELQNFDTSCVIDMNFMFNNVQSLRFIDIFHFNMQKVTYRMQMFSNTNNLRFANLYNVVDPEGILSNSGLNARFSTITFWVCQKDKLITRPGVETACCHLNLEENICEEDTSNLFRVIFASDVEYPNGFIKEYRNDIKFILGKGYNNKILPEDSITFTAGLTYEIYLKTPSNLENFFNSKKDPNTKLIKSIDVILPDSSSITSLESMFQGCSSLESITLSFIDTSSVTSFKSMFRDCSSLKIVDLSHFETSLVEGMESILTYLILIHLW